MKHIFVILISIFSLSCLCAVTRDPDFRVPMGYIRKPTTSKTAEPAKKPVPKPAAPKPVEAPKPAPTPKPAPIPTVEMKASTPVQDEEYLKSVGNLNIPKDVYEADKKSVMDAIGELAKLMEKEDFSGICNYLDSQSKAYYSQPANLKKIQNMLIKKGLVKSLKNIEDYIRFVFVPARVGKDISEIRYLSETSVNAVSVGEKEIAYYRFNKVGNDWLLHIDPLQ